MESYLMDSYRILSIDGGGVRGIISVRILQRLQKERPGFIDRFHLLAGTSTGAIISLCLAKGLPLESIFDLYYNRSKEIFSRSWLRAFGFQGLAAKYSNRGIKRVLQDTLGDTTLAELHKHVLVSSFDLDAYDGNGKRSYKPKFFHNLPGLDAVDYDRKAIDIALASSAAPTYFPSHHGYIDGGIVCNNPSMAALSQALDPKTLPEPRIEDIRLLSIGTGRVTTFVSGENLDWGYVRWIPVLVELMMNGSADVVDYECRQVLKSHYVRINPYLDKGFKLDSLKHIDRMVEVADSIDLSRYVEWLDTHA